LIFWISRLQTRLVIRPIDNMLTQQHFYNETLKKTVAVFGSCFNNITIARSSGTTRSNIERVPISYGPKQKYLARIKEQATLNEQVDVAIKIPRMSFDISSITYDQDSHLNRLNRVSSGVSASTRDMQWQSSPYNIGMQLNIFARNQDDALQILEQILPSFNPEYTLSVKDMEAPGVISNIPIALSTVTMSDIYEGPIATNRVIVYTLDFVIKIRFRGPVAPVGIIRFTEVSITPSLDQAASALSYVHVGVSSPEDTKESFASIITYDTFGFADGFIPPVTAMTTDNTNIMADSTQTAGAR